MDVKITCPCPPRADGSTRHPAGDTVTLRETLDFRSVTAIRHGIGLIENDGSSMYAAEILAVLTEGYVLFGIERWTLTDERGKPEPLSHTAIRERILSDLDRASTVGDAADDLYGEKVLLPLLVRASTSSQPGPTEPSTSVPTGSTGRRPKRSRRSSTSTSPMDATETTSSSLVGVSSFSPSSESAA